MLDALAKTSAPRILADLHRLNMRCICKFARAILVTNWRRCKRFVDAFTRAALARR